MPFAEMLATVRGSLGKTQAAMANDLGISPQYLNDLERGRRSPSVAVVDRICTYLGRGPAGVREWHIAGAAAHGWKL